MDASVWIFGATLGALMTLPLAFMGWTIHEGTKRDAFEAANPYAEVEPPRVPDRCRYVDREELDEHCRGELKSVIRGVFKQAPADDCEPQIGDVVVAYIELDDGKWEHVSARVVWPRATYVRAQLIVTPAQGTADGPRRRVCIDIPRSAIAGVVHTTGPALPFGR